MKKLLFFLCLYSMSAGAYQFTYPLLSMDSARARGYRMINSPDSLVKYAASPGSKLFISGNFELRSRVIVAANVIIESDKHIITSRLFYASWRSFETFSIQGAGVTIKGLVIKGDSPDIYTLDSMWYQVGIKCLADSFKLINCEISSFNWAALYMNRFRGMVVENCYFHHCRGAGYGYGITSDGAAGYNAVIKDCLMLNDREAADASGHPTYLTYQNCVLGSALASHRNAQGFSGSNVVKDCFIMEGAYLSFPGPATGCTLSITGNHFTGDSSTLKLFNFNPSSFTEVSGNYFNSEGLNRPFCKLIVDSIKSQRIYFHVETKEKVALISYGDGSEPFMVVNKTLRFNKGYGSGAYTLSATVFDSKGVPSLPSYSRQIIYSSPGVSFAVKSSARFLPVAGTYIVQLLINDTVQWSGEPAKLFNWKRMFVPFPGVVSKISVRLTCLRGTEKEINLWVDDLDYYGQTLNSDFESPNGSPQYKLWKYTTCSGSGLDARESCSGRYSWKLERGSNVAGNYCEIFQKF